LENVNVQRNFVSLSSKDSVMSPKYQEAMKRYRQAADQGDAIAERKIGFAYSNGQGVAQDYQEAMKWYLKAAAQGDAFAENNIGALCEHGSGVTQDYQEAMRWYRKAAAQGNSLAERNIGFLYDKGGGVTRNYQEALKWWQKAAAQDDAVAENNIGVMYDRGDGVIQDYHEAMKWYQKSAAQGNALAKKNIKILYTNGHGSSLIHTQVSSMTPNISHPVSAPSQVLFMTPDISHAVSPIHVPLFLKHIWILFVVSTFFNVYQSWKMVQVHIQKNPELETGYRQWLMVFAVVWNIPWFLMGAGILWGRVDNIWQYLMPRQGNSTVILWWESMATMAFVGVLWLFMGGAEKLEKYPGLLFIPVGGAKRIKLFAVIGLVGQLIVASLLFIGFPFSMNFSIGSIDWHSVFPDLFPFFFIGMWCLVGFSLAQIGGWASLAAEYPTTQPFEGKVFRGLAGQFGVARYSGILNIGANREGLYLSVLFIFRVGHPPLFVRWEDITASVQKGFNHDMVAMEFSKVPGVVMKLRQKDVMKLKEAADNLKAFIGLDKA
jgi:TPR repeat protein